MLLVGHCADEHGILREISCALPRPVMCRLCKGEKDCPYIADRSALRLRITRKEPEPPVPPVEHPTVGTGMDGRRVRPGVLAVAAVAWLAVAGLVLRYWVLEQPSAGEVVAVLGLKLAVFSFAVIGVPLVRLTWAHHGGRFRRRS